MVSGCLIDENKHTRVSGDLTKILLPWDNPHHEKGGKEEGDRLKMKLKNDFSEMVA